MWAGTDDGLLHVTTDGAKTWHAVTPPGVTPWSHVAGIDASHFDAATAYVAIDRHRLDDERPYLYVTRDSGKTWRGRTNGIPADSFVNAVREDPVHRGLLYAATETGVYVSFDDGAAWQSLRLNMPVVSVRDIAVHGDDLAIATHGRAFWILDDIEPLRELADDASPHGRLFVPQVAVRMRAGNDEAEASPPEVPVGENPPNGAFIDYVVPRKTRGPVVIDICCSGVGGVVRHYSSDDVAKPIDPKSVPYPSYWIETPQPPSAAPGIHRFIWDLHLFDGDGPLAAPGVYPITLHVDGKEYDRRLIVRRDPRIAAGDDALVNQMQTAIRIGAYIRSIRDDLKRADALAPAIHRVAAVAAIAGPPPSASPDDSTGSQRASDTTSLRYNLRLLEALEASVESADEAPTRNELDAFDALRPHLEAQLRALRDALSSR